MQHIAQQQSTTLVFISFMYVCMRLRILFLHIIYQAGTVYRERERERERERQRVSEIDRSVIDGSVDR